MAALRSATSRGFKGLRQKIVNSIKTAAQDYKNAGKDSLTYMKKKPLRAATYTGLVILGIQLSRKRPLEQSFIQSVTEEVGKMSLLSDAVRNKESDNHLRKVSDHIAKNHIRCQNMVFFSIIYQSDYDSDNKFYESQCKYMKPRWSNFHNQILDIGLWHKWWVLRYQMTDYDVDFNEFPKDVKGSFSAVKECVNRLRGVSYYRNPALPISEQSQESDANL